jgi:hypothetical protein
MTHSQSYLQNSTQLIINLESLHLPHNNCILVSADITSLYPNIPIDDALIAMKHMLELTNYQPYTERPVILDMLEFVLRNNYIIYDNEIYLQIAGTAMGTPCAVVVANIFLIYLETVTLKLLDKNIWNKTIFFKRYIDDIFAIFNSLEDAQYFMLKYNSAHPKIKLTIKYSQF